MPKIRSEKKQPKKNTGFSILPFILLCAVITMLFYGCSAADESLPAANTPALTSDTESVPAPAESTTPTAKPSVETTTENPEALIDFDAKYPFLIKINRAAGTTTIYGRNQKGVYNIPYKAFRCSVGNPISYTPLGKFKTSDMYSWCLMVDGSYAQYAIRIDGQIMLHSVCYHSMNPGDLKYEDFNKLGSPCSLGCIRFACGDIKWIYDNCRPGTTVVIYDDKDNPGPLGKPKQIKINPDSPNRGWDPTDPNQQNPWQK